MLFRSPSAAAELVMPNKAEVLARLDTSCRNLRTSMDHFIRAKSHRWESLAKHRALLTPQIRIEREMQRQDTLMAGLQEKMRAGYEQRRSVFSENLAKLTALDPMRVLLRGYARVTGPDGKTVDSVSCVNIEEELQIAVADGVIRSDRKSVV